MHSRRLLQGADLAAERIVLPLFRPLVIQTKTKTLNLCKCHFRSQWNLRSFSTSTTAGSGPLAPTRCYRCQSLLHITSRLSVRAYLQYRPV